MNINTFLHLEKSTDAVHVEKNSVFQTGQRFLLFIGEKCSSYCALERESGPDR